MTSLAILAALATAPGSSLGPSGPDSYDSDPEMMRSPGMPVTAPNLAPLLANGLGTSAYAPAPLAGSRLASTTETKLSGLIHFPPKLSDPGWDTAEVALGKLRDTLGPGAIVRWDGLFHEANWFPRFSFGFDRNRRIVDLLHQYGLKSLMGVVPHPWYGSGWDSDAQLTPVQQYRPWGRIPASWRPLITQRYREFIESYRQALAANGMPESEAAVQFGNEPASGHPGGDDSLPRGTWSAHPLWKAINQDPSFYGDLEVVSPAISMADEPFARREFATSTVPRAYDWTARVDAKSMHFRYYNPRALTPEAYAQGYINELKRRTRMILRLGWPRGNARQARISEGLWVTEGYVASGDCPEPRAECWRRVLKKISEGVPGVRVYTAYRFYPAGGPDGLDWSLPDAAMVPVDAPISAVPQGIRDGKAVKTSPGKKAPGSEGKRGG